jgi:hypothetical protein
MKYEYLVAKWPSGYFVVLMRGILSSCSMALLKRKAKHPKKNWIWRIN